MRVLHVGSTLELSGGIESFIINTYNYIDKDQIVFDFMVTENQKNGFYRDIILAHNGKIYTIDYDRVAFSVLKRKYQIYKQYREEVIHIHTNCGSRIFDGLVARLAGVKHIIFHCHTCKGDPSFKFRILQPLFRCLGDCYWACSSDAAKFFFGNSILKSKNYSLIHNAIDVDYYAYNETIRKKIREQNKWSKDFVIGYVGRLSPEKNIPFLLDIVKEISVIKKDVKLIIIGDGEEKLKVQKIISENNLNNHVEMLGEKQNVNEYLSAFDCLVLPSYYEGLGIVLIEAQAASLPCFASDKIPIETKVTPLISYISLKESASYWANRIQQVSVNRDNEYRELVKRSGYDSYNEAMRISELYMKICSK